MESSSQLKLYATAHNQGATGSLHYCFLCRGTLCYALVNNQQISIENLLLVFLYKMIQISAGTICKIRDNISNLQK